MGADPHGLQRFAWAQDGVYQNVLAELRAGRKHSHWMWFVFPQIYGLGRSPTSEFYAIKNLEEAAAYLAHPVLGQRLNECAAILLDLEGLSAEKIFGFPDCLKLCSSMTLFAQVEGTAPVFAAVLEKYYEGKADARTLELLGKV